MYMLYVHGLVQTKHIMPNNLVISVSCVATSTSHTFMSPIQFLSLVWTLVKRRGKGNIGDTGDY